MNPLVSPEWLAERLQRPGSASSLVVLDATLPPVGVTPKVDVRARYPAKHIPGAVFFDIDELSDHATSLPHMLPSAEAFSEAMSEMGVAGDALIVVYEQEGVFSAARARWMLRVFGAKEVYLLDGGLAAWERAGLPVEDGPVVRERAEFRAVLDAGAVRSYAEVRGILAEGGQVADARSAGRFSGSVPEPRAGLSSGHMPGSVSVPFTELAADGRMLDAEGLRKIFAAKGLDLARPITTTCGSGVTAAVVALGLELAGARDVSLYDGSWAEYAQQPDAVIEKS